MAEQKVIKFHTDENSRFCPVCGENHHELFLKERLNQNKMSDFTYSSRKQPEFMCLRLVRCLSCDTVYAPSPPDTEFLFAAYREAAYDSNEEANCAARSYVRALAPFLGDLPALGCAVDVGAGNGSLLPLLEEAGFSEVIGIEPSRAAIDAAPFDVRKKLHEGMFSSNMLTNHTPSLICSFMTLEHLREPGEFVHIAYNTLADGGKIAIVVHNWQGLLNRLLGRYSPIIDVEHLQIYSPKAVETLLAKSGFKNIKIINISNAYPMRYWLRLMPLPNVLKKIANRFFEKVGINNISIPMRVGNIMAIGER